AGKLIHVCLAHRLFDGPAAAHHSLREGHGWPSRVGHWTRRRSRAGTLYRPGHDLHVGGVRTHRLGPERCGTRHRPAPASPHHHASVTINGEGRLTDQRHDPRRHRQDYERRDLSHSNANLCTMRKVSRYQATAVTAPTVRAVACDAGGADRSVSIRYPARSSV